MGYVSPITRATAYFVTAAQWNQDVVDNQNAAFPLGVDAWTSFTPTLTQSVTVTKTVSYAKYQRVGRLIVAVYDLNVTGAGTTANDVLVGVPVTAAAIGSGNPQWGSMVIYDASTTTRYQGGAEARTTSAFALSYSQASPNVWGTTPNLALAAGDIIRAAIQYEAAT